MGRGHVLRMLWVAIVLRGVKGEGGVYRDRRRGRLLHLES